MRNEAKQVDCPHCHSTEIMRMRRTGMMDQVLAQFNRWPYFCRACNKTFHLGQRYVPSKPARVTETKPPQPERTQAAQPEMAYRVDPVRPVAKIVVEADNQPQLDSILLALSRAVSNYQTGTREHAKTK